MATANRVFDTMLFRPVGCDFDYLCGHSVQSCQWFTAYVLPPWPKNRQNRILALWPLAEVCAFLWSMLYWAKHARGAPMAKQPSPQWQPI